MAMYYSVDAFDEDRPHRKGRSQDVGRTALGRQKADQREALRRPVRDQPRLLPEFHLVSVPLAAGGEFQTKDGKSAFNSPATIQALKFWQDSIGMGVPAQAARRRRLETRCRISAPAIAPCRTSASGRSLSCAKACRNSSTASSSCQLRRAENTSPSAAAGPSSPMRKDEILRRPANSAPGRSARRSTGSVERIVDWCTKAKSDMPPTKVRAGGRQGGFRNGFLKVFTDEIYPGTRGEPRMPPPVYKAISDAIQAASSTDRIPQQAAAAASNRSTPSSPATRARRSSDAGSRRARNRERSAPRRPRSTQARALSNRARERIAGYLSSRRTRSAC